MTIDQLVSNLNKIIELTGSMLVTAREGDWEQAQEIEQQRKKIFDLTFPLDRDSIKEPDVIAGLVQQIAELDKETMNLVAEGSKELSSLIGEISAGRQAVNAYRDVEGR